MSDPTHQRETEATDAWFNNKTTGPTLNQNGPAMPGRPSRAGPRRQVAAAEFAREAKKLPVRIIAAGLGQ